MAPQGQVVHRGAAWALAFFLCTATFSAELAKVNQTIGSVIRSEGQIQTGPHSRVEVEFPSATTVRVGANADVRFTPGGREMNLESGTLLVSAREPVAIRAGPVTMRMSRGDLEMANVVGHHVKVIVLNGKVQTSFAGQRKNLRYGEMVEIPAGATEMPPVTAINLETLMATSLLMNMGPLHPKLAKNAARQKPRPYALVNTPPMIAVSRATATAAAANQIAAQQALQAQALANQQLLEARREQRIAEQTAARQAVQQAAQQLETKRQTEAGEAAADQAAQQQQGNQGRGPQGNQGRGPQGNQGRGNQGQGNQGNQGVGPGGQPPGQGGQPPGQGGPP